MKRDKGIPGLLVPRHAGLHWLVVFLGLWLASLPVYAASLAGTEWRPLRMGQLVVPQDGSVFVQFRSKGRLTGFTGCNRLMAEYQAGDGVIFVGPVAATRMACAEEVMQLEGAFASALEQARTYRRQQTELVMFDAEGQPILEMRQTDWD
jgi:putative lipoprotein